VVVVVVAVVVAVVVMGVMVVVVNADGVIAPRGRGRRRCLLLSGGGLMGSHLEGRGLGEIEGRL
jgi:hypothetical protein